MTKAAYNVVPERVNTFYKSASIIPRGYIQIVKLKNPVRSRTFT